jgi:hypothetical protein
MATQEKKPVVELTFRDTDLWGLSCALEHGIRDGYFKDNVEWAQGMAKKIDQARSELRGVADAPFNYQEHIEHSEVCTWCPLCREKDEERMESITDAMFVKEMSILWQNTDITTRNRLALIIRNYFGNDRADRIISHMQEKIEE